MDYRKNYGAAFVKKENEIRITINEFKGNLYLHIREYAMDWDSGNWFPTTSGYAILAEHVDSIIELLEKASEDIAKYYRKDNNQISFDF